MSGLVSAAKRRGWIRRARPIPWGRLLVVAALVANLPRCGESARSVPAEPGDAAGHDGAVSDSSDGPGLDIGFDDVVAEPMPTFSCIESGAKVKDATVDGGGCNCPPFADGYTMAPCDPSVDCARCQWGTCWAFCMSCSDAGNVWVRTCTE